MFINQKLIHQNNTILIVLIFVVTLFNTCGVKDRVVNYFSQEPDGEPVRQVITTGSSLGFVAAAAMSAIGSGQAPGFVQVVQTVDSYPGSGLMYINPPSNEALPPGIDPNGSIAVAGFWTEDKTAILSVFFVDMNLLQGGISFSNISTFPVVQEDSSYLLTYAMEDINSGTSDTAMAFTLTQGQIDAELLRLTSRPTFDTSITLDQEGWVIQVDNNKTVDNIFDDSYSIVGAGQHVGLGFAGEQLASGEILQIIMIECLLEQACVINPTSGWGMVRKFGSADVSTGKRSVFGTSVWMFHTACDGRADIPVGTGTYTGFSGKKVDLNL